MPPLPPLPTLRHACDCHAHVFGPFARFPLADTLTYRPPESTPVHYRAMLARLGCDRAVLVQGSAHGLDNGAMLAALSSTDASLALRGVAVATSATPADTLARWHAAGVRGLRFRHVPAGAPATHYHNTVDLSHFQALAPAMKAIGLHAQVWTHAAYWPDIEAGLLRSGVPIVVDHMARVDPDGDRDSPAFQHILDALGRGDIWVKMTAYRNTADFPEMGDMIEVTRRFLQANPRRLLWGSDWPHIHFGHAVDTPALLQRFIRWVDDPGLVRRILVDNPEALYGF